MALEDVQRMKMEVSARLVEEKARLECWFREEMTEIRRNFEAQLADERRHCSDLLQREKETMAAVATHLIEQARDDKEQAARQELERIEERLACLLREKELQIQTQLTRQMEECLRDGPAAVFSQDAAIQTDRTDAQEPIPDNSPVRHDSGKENPAAAIAKAADPVETNRESLADDVRWLHRGSFLLTWFNSGNSALLNHNSIIIFLFVSFTR